MAPLLPGVAVKSRKNDKALPEAALSGKSLAGKEQGRQKLFAGNYPEKSLVPKEKRACSCNTAGPP